MPQGAGSGRLGHFASSALLAVMSGSDEDSTSLSPVMGSRGKGPGLESQCLSSVLLLISRLINQL